MRAVAGPALPPRLAAPRGPGAQRGLGRPWPSLLAPTLSGAAVLDCAALFPRSGRSLHCAVGRMQPPPLFMSLGDCVNVLPWKLQLPTVNRGFCLVVWGPFQTLPDL